MQVDDIDVFIGIDVGKSEHWATALTTAGECLHDRPLPNDEASLREVYEHLGEHGRLLVVVDQPATIGALAVAVAQDMGITMGYPPELAMRRTADPAPDSAKTDAKDAAVIAGAARTMPPTLRAISTSEEDTAALSMLSLVSTRTRPARSTRARAASGRQALPTTRNEALRRVSEGGGQSSSPPHDPQPTTELSAAARHTA